MWHPARKTTQTLVFLLVLATPSMALFDVVEHVQARYGDSLAARRIAEMSPLQAFLVRAQAAIIGERSRNARPLSETLAGTPWALRVGEWKFVEPLNALGALAAGGGAYGMVLLAALPLLVLTLAMGRVFCGWLCPIHFILEMADSLRLWLKRLGVPLRDFRLHRRTKYAVLGLGTVATAALGAQIFPLIYPPAVLGRQMYMLIFFGGLGGGALFLLAVVLVEVFLSRRIWCRYLCPGGALYAALSPLRVVRIERKPSLCDGCGDCNQACAFGLSPMTDTTGIECTSCMECERACPADALSLVVRTPLVLEKQEEEA